MVAQKGLAKPPQTAEGKIARVAPMAIAGGCTIELLCIVGPEAERPRPAECYHCSCGGGADSSPILWPQNSNGNQLYGDWARSKSPQMRKAKNFFKRIDNKTK